ncbi:MAG: 2-oxo acid dehydrogenase subunit E2, partial [Deltaproteobacteria bacterium]|nr:2-oxo acid dehydrogenase subunit E2 [Deltaproteobacteria bacterium]
MVFEFKLPDLGEGITEGEVVKWRVKEGDSVEEHQIILEVETDKAIVEVPSPKKGRVVKLNKAEGDTVAVGETLVKIELEGAPGPEKAPARARESVSVVGTLPDTEEVMAVPKARALAKKMGIDIASITGSGPGGLVTENDVTSAAERAGVAPPAEKPAAAEAREAGKDKFGSVERVPIKGVRKSITKTLLASQRNAAFVTGMDEADVTELWDLRERERKNAKEKGIHLTFLPFFMKAVQHSLVAHPYLNGSVDEKGEEIIVKKYYNIGVAVDTPDGLMVSVVKNVDRKTILELA